MDPLIERYREAYLMMAGQANYRPQAPSDGCGNIQLSSEQLQDQARLQREATDYAVSFAAEEDTLSYRIGCSHFETNRAFVWLIEAARQLASGGDGNPTALKLIKMAQDEIRSAPG